MGANHVMMSSYPDPSRVDTWRIVTSQYISGSPSAVRVYAIGIKANDATIVLASAIVNSTSLVSTGTVSKNTAGLIPTNGLIGLTGGGVQIVNSNTMRECWSRVRRLNATQYNSCRRAIRAEATGWHLPSPFTTW